MGSHPVRRLAGRRALSLQRAGSSNDISPAGEKAIEREAPLQRVGRELLRRLDVIRVQHAAVIKYQPIPFGGNRADAGEAIVGAAHIPRFDAIAPRELLRREALTEFLAPLAGIARQSVRVEQGIVDDINDIPIGELHGRHSRIGIEHQVFTHSAILASIRDRNGSAKRGGGSKTSPAIAWFLI